MRKLWTGLGIVLAPALLVGCGMSSGGSATAASGSMVLATTTSTQDSGLLDVLIPAYEKSSDCSVKTVAVGSGAALEMGVKGDADVLLVHSPDAEKEYMAQGHGLTRYAVMHNDFVLVGPASDPAGIKGSKDAADALRRIAAKGALFASRADDSGTNAEELKLWAEAGVDPAKTTPDWYIETGQGMGATLTIASQKQAYTLTDRSTFLATKNLSSSIDYQGAPDLQNNYHVIVVKHDGTNLACARQFSSWIRSGPVQKTIGRFGIKQVGQRLFHPDARG